MKEARNRIREHTGKVRVSDYYPRISLDRLTDEFGKLDALRARVRDGAAGAHLSGRRSIAPMLHRAGQMLEPICSMLVPWRAGLRMRRAPLEKAIIECLLLFDKFEAHVGSSMSVDARNTLERVLADLQRRRRKPRKLSD